MIFKGAVVLKVSFPSSDCTIADAKIFGNFSEGKALLDNLFDSGQFEFPCKRSFLAHLLNLRIDVYSIMTSRDSVSTNLGEGQAVLEVYGLAEKVNGTWAATSRGQRITAVWTSFNRRGATEVATTARQWLLGPGEFTVDEMIRDRSEINDLARGFGITDAGSAMKYLEDRRRAADRFESFLVDWPRTRSDTKRGLFAEAIVFDAVSVAETDEALSRLEELFAANVGDVVGRCTPAQAAEGRPDRDGKADAAESLRKSGQDVLKRFEEARRNQRKVNHKLAQAKATCEAWLARAWLTANVGSLRDVFDAEPAAFVFRSTVPLAATEAPRRPAVAAPRSSQAAEPKQEEGVLRSLFRWLFG
jgi:hypothetical protein